jgi:hypothetical protein
MYLLFNHLYVCDGDGFYDDDPSCLMFVFNRGTGKLRVNRESVKV